MMNSPLRLHESNSVSEVSTKDLRSAAVPFIAVVADELIPFEVMSILSERVDMKSACHFVTPKVCMTIREPKSIIVYVND